jgi:hypothetical protein
MASQVPKIVNHINNYERCIFCSDLTPIDYGYFVSWTHREFDLQYETDKRFFCSLECLNQWLDQVATIGYEQIDLVEV